MRNSTYLVRTVAAAALVAGLSLIPSGAAAAPNAPAAYVSNPASLVNTFIGTTNGGDTFPGADAPFGMIQWSPDTPSRPSGGGYYYNDSSILGYSLTHLSGPGCSADGDVPILPTTGAVGTNPSVATEPLDHAHETATPGSYALNAGGVDTQLATTTRAGIAKFTFPASSANGNLLFKLSDSAAPDTATHFQVVSNKEVSGWVTSGFFCGASNQYTLHFDMVFNRPFTAYGTWTNGSAPQAQSKSMSSHMSAAAKATARKRLKVQALKAMAAASLPGSSRSLSGHLRTRSTMAPQPPVTGADGGYVTFNTASNAVVKAKVGISFVNTDNAGANLAKEIPGWDVAQVKSATHTAWNNALGKIQIAGGTPAQQTVFYTALYHSLLHPNVDSDVNGQYTGFDGQLHTMPSGHVLYANYSGWDIYRSQTQLEAMLFPKRASDTVTSMLDDYDQTGMLPKWSENNGESYVMVGDPADPIIADAYSFGARSFNAGQALKDMQTEANVPNNIRPGLNYYENTGYLPSDGQYGCCNFYGPVSTQEEYNAADNAIAVMARAMGKGSVASTFAARANNWQNVFNPGSEFLQPKLNDGAFQSGFDPTSGNGFVEANAYVYTAELPFDVAGLAKAEGGDSAWVSFLDGLTSSVTGMGPTQAQLGNEPSFDIPWEYDYLGAPYKAQHVVREVQDQLYTNAPGGLAGNDDLGAMSSWYVFSALGGYPETPGSATLALGSPMFSRIAIHLGNGKTITENAPQAADDAPYVQSVTLNGSSWDKAYLPASLLKTGGTVNWVLGSTPSTTWASAPGDAPPSDTSGVLPALGYVTGPGSNTNSRIVTPPGSSTTLTLGVQNMTNSGQTISWTASQPSGSNLQIGPSSGSMFAGKEAKATQSVQVTVPAGTPDGLYQVTFQMRSATGTALPPVVEEIAVASPGDLTPYFNNTGISSDTNESAANYDSDGFSYSEQALAAQGVSAGGSVTSGGVQYKWPSAAAGQPDNVIAGGQTIQLLRVAGESEIGFLGSATNGPSTGPMTVTYTDGSSQQVSLGFSDWTLNAGGSPPSYGNTEIASMSYRNSVAGTPQSVGTFVFAATVPVAAGKTVASVTLPASTNQGELHVFAVGSDKGPLTN